MAHHGKIEALVPDRLSSKMVSFRLLVLASVRDYIQLMGQSPSIGELSNRLGASRTRIRESLKSLARDGLACRAEWLEK